MSFVLVYDLGGTKCDAGIFDQNGSLLQKKRIFTKAVAGKEVVLQQLLELAEKFTNEYEISAFVIGVPGAIAKDQTTIIKAPNIAGFEQINLKEIFGKKFPGATILIENDANLFALSCYEFTDYKPEIFLGITLGTGIGGGVILNGSLLRGEDGLVGEFGHMVIDFNGIPCHCGQKGCWEKYASATALMQQTKIYFQANSEIQTILPKKNLIMEDFKNALVENDEIALFLLQKVTDYIALGLTNLIHIINPGLIILGGSLGNLLPYYRTDLIEKIERRLMYKKIRCKVENLADSDLALKGGFFLLQQFS